MLALLGLPAAADMPGRVLEEAFAEPLDGERIASYEPGGGQQPTSGRRPEADPRSGRSSSTCAASATWAPGSRRPQRRRLPPARHRANVAYLMGDLEAAAAALERALELEPDNVLYRQNLERLRREGGS